MNASVKDSFKMLKKIELRRDFRSNVNGNYK